MGETRFDKSLICLSNCGGGVSVSLHNFGRDFGQSQLRIVDILCPGSSDIFGLFGIRHPCYSLFPRFVCAV